MHRKHINNPANFIRTSTNRFRELANEFGTCDGQVVHHQGLLIAVLDDDGARIRPTLGQTEPGA